MVFFFRSHSIYPQTQTSFVLLSLSTVTKHLIGLHFEVKINLFAKYSNRKSTDGKIHRKPTAYTLAAEDLLGKDSENHIDW